MTLSLRVRDEANVVGAEVDPELWSGTLVERDTIPSTLEATGPLWLMEKFFLDGSGSTTFKYGCVLDDDAGARFSGILTQVRIAPGKQVATCTWDSDTLRMWERIVYPNPAQAWQSQTADYWTHASAPAETVALDLIAAQMGPSAALTYRRSGITVPASAGRGSARTAKLRFDNIGRWVSDFGEANGLRFRILDSGSGPAVTVRAVVDRTTAVAPAVPAIYGSSEGGGPGRLADDSAEITLAIPERTVSLVAGGGDLAARVLRERQDAPSLAAWRRIEELNEQTSTTDTTELDGMGDQSLLEGSKPVEISGVTILDSPGLVLGKDVLLGDLVGVDLYLPSPINDRLRQITTTVANGRYTVTGAIGSADAGLTRRQTDYLKQARQLRKVPT